MRRNRVITLLAVLAAICAWAMLLLLLSSTLTYVDFRQDERLATKAFVETNNARVETALAATETARAQQPPTSTPSGP